MPALRTLGLVVLAAFVVSLGVLGYRYARALLNERDARGAALKVDAAVQAAISTGNPQTENVSIPGGYTMRFAENQTVVDGFRVPERGYVMRFADNCPELGAGAHTLLITIEGSRVVIKRM